MTKEQSQELIHLVTLAHYNAAKNNKGNISTTTAMIAHQGSGNPYQAIAAGILSMGGSHAPIDGARSLIKRYKENREQATNSINFLLDKKIKIPGFGNSFYKDQIDPSFKPAYDKYLEIMGVYNPVEGISEVIYAYFRAKNRNIVLFPNAAIITAAIAEACELYSGQEIAIALQGRISAWIELMDEAA